MRDANTGINAWKNPPNCKCFRALLDPILEFAVARSLYLKGFNFRLFDGVSGTRPCKMFLQQSLNESMQDLSIVRRSLFLCFFGNAAKVLISLLLRARRVILHK